MIRARRHAGVWLAVALGLAACGGGHDADDLSGTWQGRFATADGDVILSEDAAGALAGTLSIDTYVWSLTGATAAPDAVVLVLLPARDEDALFAALGVEGIGGGTPAHAADRVELYGTVAPGGGRIDGAVTTAIAGPGGAFTLSR